MAQGFTLLELLVVLVLLALSMGLVAPQAGRWLEGVQARGWRADLLARVETLPVNAFLAGEALSMDAEQLQQGLPGQSGSVQVRLAAPLRYSALGMASGGRIELRQGAAVEVWLVRPVTGEVVINPPDAGKR